MPEYNSDLRGLSYLKALSAFVDTWCSDLWCIILEVNSQTLTGVQRQASIEKVRHSGNPYIIISNKHS